MTKDGKAVSCIQMDNGNGMSVCVLNYGGIIQSIVTPDRRGNLADVVLGYDILSEYEANDCYFGATIGRVANRIAGASFELDGKHYQLTANEGANTLHGGGGYHKKIWDYEILEDALVLKYKSPDGEDGFPGTLKVEQKITLSEENVLRIDYFANSDRTTLCSLTNHSYFNLGGNELTEKEEGEPTRQTEAGSRLFAVTGHQLQIAANEYTPVGEDLIPMGEILPVEGSVYDFLSARDVGETPLDSNLVLSAAFKKWDARIFEPRSGRFLSIKTSLPGLQLYNGSGISHQTGKGGVKYGPLSGLALEPQFYPDAIHHPEFPQPILKAGEEYRHFIEYKFGIV